jgi:hypothetical protein
MPYLVAAENLGFSFKKQFGCLFFVWCKLMLRWKSFEESVVAMGLVGVGGGTSMAGER